MESGRSYGEPELQKMAAFLRERCEKSMYGLTYYDDQKTMIRIPWHTVPRQNEDVSDNFNMFKEWAYLSFRKRGNRGEQLENEALSAQKHRFRNALARADGLRQVKELSTDHMRIYEFVDTKKEREHNGHNRNSPLNCYETDRTNRNSSPNHYEYESMNVPTHVHPAEFSDSNHTLEYQNCWGGSPMTVTSSPNQTPGYQNPNAFQVPNEPPDIQEGRQLSFGSFLEEIMNAPEPTAPFVQHPGNEYNHDTYAREAVHVSVAEPMQTNYHAPSALQVPTYNSAHHANGIVSQVPQQDHHLLVKVYFRGEEVKQKPVWQLGFRLYSGNNIPDMRRLLDENQKNQLQSMTRYPADYLFGPENVCQVEMPPVRCSAHVYTRTSQIVDNMDRGIVFFLEFPANETQPFTDFNIPNVYAMRLCQTRVFPYDTNVQHRAELEEEGLRRLECVQIFDASEFTRRMRSWVSGTPPSYTIQLAVGQKHKRASGECNLVSVSILVSKAKMMVERNFEDQMEEIYISDKTSMDNAAQQHKHEVQARIQMNDADVF